MQYQRRPPNAPQVKKKRVFTRREEEEDEEQASPQYAGHYAGLHPEDTPHMTTADVRSRLAPPQRPAYEPDEYEAGNHIRAMARRYNGVPMPDGVIVRQGNDQIYYHTGRPPIERASRTKTKTTEQVPVVAKKQRRRLHPLFFVGLGLLVMIIGYVAINAFGSWWQTHNDDSMYGRPRTYQTDAVVGHGDSTAHPSHFIAVNLNRHIIIIEIPGGDVSRSVIYSAGVLFGDGEDLAPVTLTFQDVNGNGKPNMLVHVLDQTIVFTNNSTKFVPPSNVVANGGSNPPNLGE